MARWNVPCFTRPMKRAIRKKQSLYRKAKQLQAHEKKKQKINKDQAFKRRYL